MSGVPGLPALEQLKESTTCSICLELMTDPVIVCKNVHTYDRHCITAWGKKTCPECRGPLLTQFLPHRLVSQNIEIYQKAMGKNQTPSLASRVQPPTPPKVQPAVSRCPVIEAVQEGDETAVRELIKKGANINHTHAAGGNAIFYAKTRGIVERLLEAGAKVRCAPLNRELQEQAVFLNAVAQDNLVTAKEMLENGLCDINGYGQQSPGQPVSRLSTALHIATRSLLPMMTRLLIGAGANLEVTIEAPSLLGPKKATPLLSLLTNVHVRSKLSSGQQPNLDAYNKCIELLLRAGASIRAPGPGTLSMDGPGGTVAFVEAVEYCPLNTLKLFLRRGANVNVADRRDWTALHNAIYRCHGSSHLAIIQFLIGAGANISGGNPLILAARAGHLFILKYLLGLGAFVYAPRMYTPLHAACRCAQPVTVEFLLTHAPPRGDRPKDYINAFSSCDETPLILVCDVAGPNAVKCVELLLDHGADPNIPDQWGKTPLLVACQNNCLGIAELLIAKGADPHISSKRGDTPIESAKRHQNNDLVALLERTSLNSFCWMR